MKRTLGFSTAIVLSLTACEPMNRSISSGGFDPLSAPGRERHFSTVVGPAFSAGQFVRAAMDNTAFFKNQPKGDADADKLLMRGASMKVISISDSYAKVELDSGEVGYVPTVMLENPNAVMTAPAVNPNEFQVYPPLDGYGQPLPPVVPAVAPPEGVIPTVIDPEAPPMGAPATGPAPLPPNGEELEAEKPSAEAVPKLEE